MARHENSRLQERINFRKGLGLRTCKESAQSPLPVNVKDLLLKCLFPETFLSNQPGVLISPLL